MDRWNTFQTDCFGGLILNQDQHALGARLPGAAIELQNYEPNAAGPGYRRIRGYEEYDAAEVTGTGNVLGVCVFNDGVLAARSDEVYFSTGSGWTKISTTSHTGGTRFRFKRYRWSSERVAFVDEVNYPAKWDGTTYTRLTNAPQGATCLEEYKNHLFFGKDRTVTFSVPNDDEDYSAVNGAGSINVGDTIVALANFRDFLFIFCKNSIHYITGNDSSDFLLKEVTSNIGCMAADSVQEVSGDLLFLAPDGLRPISATVRENDFEIASISQPVKTLIDSFSAWETYTSVVIRSKNQYRLLPTFDGVGRADTNGLIAVNKVNPTGARGWEFAKTTGICAICADSGYLSTGPELIVHACKINAKVYKQESGNSFDGDNIVAIYQTPYITFGDISRRKTLYKTKLYIDRRGAADLNLNVVYDYNDSGVLQPDTIRLDSEAGGTAAFYGSAVYGGAAAIYSGTISPALDQNLVGSGFVASLKFTTNDVNPPHTVKSYVVQFGAYGRR